MSPRVSVITVVRNAADTIARTIESVLSQDYCNIEYVIIDGASTDGTLQCIDRYRERIAILVSEDDGGLYFGMQKGLHRSTGDLVLFLNADDAFADDQAISRLVDARMSCDTQEPVLCFSNFIKFYPKIDRSFLVIATGDLRQGMDLCHQAMLADRRAYDRIGGFDTNFRLSADFDWVVRAKRGGVQFVKASGPPTVIYKLGGISENLYRASRAEAAKIIRREYGRGAFLRYVMTQRWRFCLRSGYELVQTIFGPDLPNAVRVAYLRVFRAHRVLNSIEDS